MPMALDDRDVAGGQRLGLAEGDRNLLDAQPGQVGVPAGRQQSQAVGGGLERGGLRPPADGDRCDVGVELVGADVDRAVDDPRESGAALIGGQGLAGGGIDGQGVAARVDGRAAGQEGDGLGRPAVVCSQRAEARVGDADLVAVDAVDQAAGAAGADQVVRAGRGDRAGDVVGRRTDAGPVGVQRDDRVVQGGRAGVDIQPRSR